MTQYGADPTGDLCYTKNLWQWAEELHRRRANAATLWANLQSLSYPALADPYAATYQVRFQNNSGSAKLFTCINPSRCDPSTVGLGGPLNGLPSALGVIKVLPWFGSGDHGVDAVLAGEVPTGEEELEVQPPAEADDNGARDIAGSSGVSVGQ